MWLSQVQPATQVVQPRPTIHARMNHWGSRRTQANTALRVASVWTACKKAMCRFIDPAVHEFLGKGTQARTGITKHGVASTDAGSPNSVSELHSKQSQKDQLQCPSHVCDTCLHATKGRPCLQLQALAFRSGFAAISCCHALLACLVPVYVYVDHSWCVR